MTLDEIKKKAIVESLERNRGNITHTARELEITIRTLQRYIHRHKLGTYVALARAASMSDNATQNATA